MSPRPDVVTLLQDRMSGWTFCEKTRWVGVARLARRCRIQKNETLNTTTTHVHCRKSIGCTAQQFVRETLQASHPKKTSLSPTGFRANTSCPRLDSVCVRVMMIASTNVNTTLHIFPWCLLRNEQCSERGTKYCCNLILMGPSHLCPVPVTVI